jgi:hypothetical protein
MINTVVQQKMGYLLTRWATVSFSRRTVLHVAISVTNALVLLASPHTEQAYWYSWATVHISWTCHKIKLTETGDEDDAFKRTRSFWNVSVHVMGEHWVHCVSETTETKQHAELRYICLRFLILLVRPFKLLISAFVRCVNDWEINVRFSIPDETVSNSSLYCLSYPTHSLPVGSVYKICRHVKWPFTSIHCGFILKLLQISSDKVHAVDLEPFKFL